MVSLSNTNGHAPQQGLHPPPETAPEPTVAEVTVPPTETPADQIAGQISVLDSLDPRLTPKQRAYLVAFAATCSHRRAAQAASTHRSSAPRWCKSDPIFREALALAERAVFDRLHDEALHRALAGPKDPGSTTLLCRLLQVYGDGRFRPTQKIEHSGAIEYQCRIILGRDEQGEQVIPSY